MTEGDDHAAFYTGVMVVAVGWVMASIDITERIMPASVRRTKGYLPLTALSAMSITAAGWLASYHLCHLLMRK